MISTVDPAGLILSYTPIVGLYLIVQVYNRSVNHTSCPHHKEPVGLLKTSDLSIVGYLAWEY